MIQIFEETLDENWPETAARCLIAARALKLPPTRREWG